MKRLKKFLARGKKRKQYIRICDNIVYLSDNGEFSNIEKYVNLLDRTNKMMRMLGANAI